LGDIEEEQVVKEEASQVELLKNPSIMKANGVGEQSSRGTQEHTVFWTSPFLKDKEG
jgi:hypothetical protein